MLLFADNRSFDAAEDRFQHCTICGKDLVVLPNDRRGGSCFDCLSFAALEYEECAECGAPRVAGRLLLACPRCGAVPARAGY